MPEHPTTRANSSPVSSEAVEAHLERLQEDLARLKKQIRHSQRLAALGTAAAMLAHEINNLMTPVMGYAKFALDKNDPELMTKALGITLKQIESVMAMTERVLGMAVDEPVVFRSVPLAGVIDDAVQCLCRDLGKDGIDLTVEVADDLNVRANPKQLQQVFFNLLLNSREALEGQTGRISVRVTVIDEDTVEVSVSDTGRGITADHLESIFDDFFTTKSNSGNGSRCGSGLGLSVCRDIIEEHRGRITVQSRPGETTTFSVTLPTA